MVQWSFGLITFLSPIAHRRDADLREIASHITECLSKIKDIVNFRAKKGILEANEKFIMLKSCPQCGQQLNPPIQSINRQVCYSCGWSGEVVVETPKIHPSSEPNQVINKLKKLKPLLSSKKTFWSLLIATPLLLMGSFFYHRQANQILPETSQLLEEFQRLDVNLNSGINKKDYKEHLDSIEFINRKIEQINLKKRSKRDQKINLALLKAQRQHYMALDIWKECRHLGWFDNQNTCEIWGDTEIMEIVLKEHPNFDELNNLKRQTSISSNGEINYVWNGDALMQILWSIAEDHLKDAENLAKDGV